MGAEPGKNNFTKARTFGWGWSTPNAYTLSPHTNACTLSPQYYVDEFGRINSTDYAANAKQMVAEIGVRGPIACAVCVTPAFEAYTAGTALFARHIDRTACPCRLFELRTLPTPQRYFRRYHQLHLSGPLHQHRGLRHRKRH